MDDPVATCFRIAKIEHDEIVARGSNKAPIGDWRNIAITLTTRGRELQFREARLEGKFESRLLGPTKKSIHAFMGL